MTLQTTYSMPSAETITRVELENGIIVLVYENHNAPSIVLAGSILAGSKYEPYEKNGLASITAGSLMRGTQNRDFDAIHSELESIGADLNISSRTHSTGFSGKSLTEDLPTLLDVLNDALRYPAFPEDQVNRLIGEQLTYLQYQQQDTRYRASRSFRENLYPSHHPYHYPNSGSPETLANITTDDLKTFHSTHYGPTGMIVTVVGDIRANEAVDLVRQQFADWSNPDQPSVPELPQIDAPQEIQRAYVGIPGKTQSDVVLGTLGPSRYDDRYVAATLANSVLGEFGMMGRVGGVIREELGLAYYAYSRVEGGKGPGAWHITAGVAPQNVELTIEKAREELQKISTQLVSDDDLADNQSYFTGRLPLRLATNAGLATNIWAMESYGLGLDYLVNYQDMIYALTKEDLLTATSTYLDPGRLVISVAGPEQ